jgi:hypothetical protein
MRKAMVYRKLTYLFFLVYLSILLPAIHTEAATFEIGEIILQKEEENGEQGLKFIVNDVYIYNYPNKDIYFGFRIKQGNWLDGSDKKQSKISVSFDPAHWETAAWFFYPLHYLQKRGNPDKPYHGYFSIIEDGSEKMIASKDILFSIKSMTDYCIERIPELEKHPVIQNVYYDKRLTGKWVGINLEVLQQMKVTISRLSMTNKGKGILREEQWKLIDSGKIERDHDASSIKNFHWFIEFTAADENTTIPELRIKEERVGKDYSLRYAIFETGTFGWMYLDNRGKSPMLDAILFFPEKLWETYWEETSHILAYALADPVYTISMEHIPLTTEIATMYWLFHTSLLME